MFKCVKQHPVLFISLFVTPLLVHCVLNQLGPLEHFKAAIEGIIVGGAGGVVSALIALLLFHFLPVGKYSILYAIGWLIPFCFFSLFGFGMANDSYPPPSIVQALVVGLPASIVYGCCAGSFGALLGIIPATLDKLASL